MKFKLLFFVVMLTSLHQLFAQDVIKKRNGQEVKALVREVNPTEIKYVAFDNKSGPIYIILKDEVEYIIYENGSKDEFTITKAEPKRDTVVVVTKPQPQNQENLYLKGRTDANLYYNGYKPAGTGTFLVSLLSPLVGLLPAAICASTPPSIDNLNIPNHNLANDREYYSGYVSQAQSIKSKKVWRNWGIALGINIIGFVILTN